MKKILTIIFVLTITTLHSKDYNDLTFRKKLLINRTISNDNVETFEKFLYPRNTKYSNDYFGINFFVDKEILNKIIESKAENISKYLLDNYHMNRALKAGDLEVFDLYHEMMKINYPEDADSKISYELSS